MNVRYIIFAIIVTITFASCATLKKTRDNSDKYIEIKKIATDELATLLDNIPNGSEHLYGFKNRDEILNARVGDPFVFFVAENGNIKESDMYRLPLIAEDNYKALITVEKTDGNYHIVDFGANILANEIEKVCNANIDKSFKGILRLYTLNCDFAVMSFKNDLLFYPLTSAKMYLQSIGINPAMYYSQHQITNLIKNK